MKKSIGVISQLSSSANFYMQTLRKLFGQDADIYTYSIEDKSIRSITSCDLYLNSCTSFELMHDEWAKDYLPPEEKTVRAAVTFTRSGIQLLKTYPEHTKAILVNQNQHMAMECITQLYHLGITNIEFFPFSPESEEIPPADVAFHFGPSELLENSVPSVDLGMRRLTSNTIAEIALKLGLTGFLDSRRFSEYIAGLAEADYSLQRLSLDSLTNENKLNLILNGLDAGIVCINEAGNITLVNDAARGFLRIRHSQVMDKPASEVIPELDFRLSSSGSPKLVEIRGKEYGITITPLMIREKHLGAFAKITPFERDEALQSKLRLQKSKKPHQAKYTFDTIIGTSTAMQKVKRIAKHVADGDASILIQGESGTGKELFAQAIHNASPRREQPFIAVNCAALTETLLESELFGYVEGAFTGAKKGGKIGFFEYAHNGTLFLDEIEAMSPMLQAKLLRVLQEREVVRIGSIEPIPINVRILSSTNENLLQRVEEGSFRGDLYYRLNVIPLTIPPLRKRNTDIPLLVQSFCQEMNASFTFSDRSYAALLQHTWPGNVRELRNCIEYLQYTKGSGRIGLEDLPEHLKIVTEEKNIPSKAEELLPLEYHVLRVLADAHRQGRGIGRQFIVSSCTNQGITITEHDVRLILQDFQNKGYIISSKGRGGTKLSPLGAEYYASIQDIPFASLSGESTK